MNTEKLAEILYDNYCAYVGGKAYNGLPLPDWAAFSADPSKHLQADAWRKVAADAARYAKEFEIRAYRSAKLAEFTDQELLLELMTRHKEPQVAPHTITMYVPHVLKTVAIDKDHTAAIIMPTDDFEVLSAESTTGREMGEISDGHHTFNELYEHRHALTLALISVAPSLAWISKAHHDGAVWEGWFIAGLKLPTGDISYHLPERLWQTAVDTGAIILDHGHEWDGHTSNDVIERLVRWVTTK